MFAEGGEKGSNDTNATHMSFNVVFSIKHSCFYACVFVMATCRCSMAAAAASDRCQVFLA